MIRLLPGTFLPLALCAQAPLVHAFVIDAAPCALAISNDARFVATGGPMGDALVLEIATGRVLARLAPAVEFADTAPDLCVRALAFDAKDAHLVVLGDGIVVWEWRAMRAVAFLQRRGAERIVLDPGGRRFWLGTSAGEWRALHGETFAELASRPLEPPVPIASPARAQDDGRVLLPREGKPALDLRGHRAALCGLAFTADGKHLVVATERALVAHLDDATTTPIRALGAIAAGRTGPDVIVANGAWITFHHGKIAMPMRRVALRPAVDLHGLGAVSPDGRFLAARMTRSADAVLVDLETGVWRRMVVDEQDAGTFTGNALRFADDGLLVYDCAARTASSAMCWRLGESDGRGLPSVVEVMARGDCTSVDPHGRIFVTGGGGLVRIGGDPRAHNPKLRLDGIVCLDGELGLGWRGAELTLWSLNDLAPLRSVHQADMPIRAVLQHPATKTVALAFDGRVELRALDLSAPR